MTKKTLRIAMIGSGFIARVHSNAFRQVRYFFPTEFDLEQAVLCGRDTAKTAKAAADWGWNETTTDWQSVVARKDIDIIDIAVPNTLHAPIAIAAANAGKIILCEKPLAMSLAEAQQMTQAVRKVPNLVWFNYRRIPAAAFARQLVDRGSLGQPFHWRALYLNQSANDPKKTGTWRYRKADAGSGAAGDLLSHLLDFALYLNGPITEVNAMMHTFDKNRDVDDATLLLARFANGSIGTFEATRLGVGFRNRNGFEMNGSKGWLGFDFEDMNFLEFCDATDAPALRAAKRIMVTGPDHPYADNFWKPGHPIGYEHTFIATLGDFLQTLERGKSFHPNFEDALSVQRLLDAIERSSASRTWVSVG
jgi:predicted dehydrogenase